MGIEDRITELENLTKGLTEKVNYLEKVNHDKWLSAKELAEIMGCSTNNIYIKIRKGEIFATNKLGAIPRIPLSQFYNSDKDNVVSEIVRSRISDQEKTMKQIVFGM